MLNCCAVSGDPKSVAMQDLTGLLKIWEIIAKLLSPEGCPWDRKQTPASMQTYLVEEAHEAASAIRSGNPAEVMDELGDVLFLVLFLVYLYAEADAFDLADVCAQLSAKMQRRHPHVFAATVVTSIQEICDNWEQIKSQETSAKGKTADLQAIPETLPSLMRAHRMLTRLAKRDSSLNDMAEQHQGLADRFKHIGNAYPGGVGLGSDDIGSMLLSLTNLARLNGFRAEDCLHQALKNLLPTKK